jgi:hypothetical protein
MREQPSSLAYAPPALLWGKNGAAYQLNTGSNLLNAYDYPLRLRPRRHRLPATLTGFTQH